MAPLTSRLLCGSSCCLASVRYWHIADVPLTLTNVCFEGKNGHDAGMTPFPLMTQSRHSASMAFTQPSVVATAFLNLTASAPVHKEARRPAKGLLHQWRSPRAL